MRVIAEGWRRFMGSNSLGTFNLADAEIQTEADNAVWQPDSPVVRIESDEITIGWRRAVRLSGNYLVMFEVKKSEVALLFRLCFGGELTPEVIREAGLSLSEVRPSGRELHAAVRDMTVGEFLLAIRAEQAQPDTSRCFDRNLLRKVDELPLQTRTAERLKAAGISYLGDLVRKTEEEMLRVPNFRRVCLRETKDVLAEMGLNFGMEVPGWPS